MYIILASLFVNVASAIWPVPISYSEGSATVVLSEGFTIEFNGPNGTVPTGCVDTSSKVWTAIDRTYGLLNDGFMPDMLYQFEEDFEPTAGEMAEAQVLEKLVITQSAFDTSLTPKIGEVNESYVLNIPDNSSIATVTAESSFGVLWALQSFNQLFYTHTNKQLYTSHAPVSITDEPKFQHRGLNMDLSRHFYPKDVVMRVIDTMSWQKFNRFHMHITDSQSWPLEIPSLPELAEKGAYGKDLWYSAADLNEMLEYAAARGIQAFIEIDMPGHTNSISYSHPDLIAASNIQPNWPMYANQPPSGQLKLNNSDVKKFMGSILDDVLPRTGGASNYFHSGGDEVNVNVYALDPGVNSNVSTVIQPYLQDFVLGIHDQIFAANRTPIVWEEMLLQWNVSLNKDVLVQVWQSAANAKLTTGKGYKTIVGSYDFWYLDCGRGQWLDFGPKVYQQFYPFLDYCNPLKNWRLIYSYDPLFNLTAQESKLVVGGEVHLWSEQTDEHNIDRMLWPRACAAGEVLWSGRQDSDGVNRTLTDAAIRLQEFRERLVVRGVQAEPFTQQWCVQRRGECSFPAAAA